LSSEAKYVVGIDLGTTHCVVAYAPIMAEDEKPNIRIFEILQITSERNAIPLVTSLFLVSSWKGGR